MVEIPGSGGRGEIEKQAGDSLDVPPGEMIVLHPGAARFPRPVILNMKKLIGTSRLLDNRTFGELRGPSLQPLFQLAELASALLIRRGVW